MSKSKYADKFPVWCMNAAGIKVALPRGQALLAMERDKSRTFRFLGDHEIPDVPEVKQYEEDPTNLTEKGRVRLEKNKRRQEQLEEQSLSKLSFQELKKKAVEEGLTVETTTTKKELKEMLEKK